MFLTWPRNMLKNLAYLFPLLGTMMLEPGLVYAQDCWERIPDGFPQPGPTSQHAMVHDSSRSVEVLFGGTIGASPNAHNETWEWSCSTRTWTQKSPATSPSARYAHAIAYDSSRGVVVLFGGASSPIAPGNELQDTWEYNETTWTQRSPATMPGKRLAHGMVYDVGRGKVVMFGGHVAGTRLNDTWEWDGTNWTLKATTGPAPREYPAMGYDSNCGVVILFGGQDTTPHFDDTWKWDGTTWTVVSPLVSPAPRYGSGMTYDPVRQKLVMVGGNGPSYEPGTETWEFSWNCSAGTWEQATGWSQRPPARVHTALAFDSACSRNMLFGGYRSVSERLNDTWVYPNSAGMCIPTVSEWGVAVLLLLLLTAGTVAAMKRANSRAS